MKHSAERKAFDGLINKVLSVSHKEMKLREATYEKQAAMIPKRRGPKLKVKPLASGRVSG